MRPCSKCGSAAYETHISSNPAPGYEVHKCQDCGHWWCSFILVYGHSDVRPHENIKWGSEDEFPVMKNNKRAYHRDKRRTEGWTIV